MGRDKPRSSTARTAALQVAIVGAINSALAARQPGAELPVGQARTRVDGGFIAELFPGVADRASNMAPLYVAGPAQGIDLGPARELLRRRIAQWSSHLPTDPGAPGTVEISDYGESGYNNDVRMYREGIALMDDVLALIDQHDSAPGVGNG